MPGATGGVPIGDSDHIEAIKQLEARDCRTMDTKDWAPCRQLVTDDETYRRADGRWRIASSTLTRLRTDFTGAAGPAASR